MALNNAAADAAGTAIANALTALPAADKQDAVKIWQTAMRLIYARIAQDAAVTVTLPASSVVTVGSATTQTGPAAPVPLSGTVS